MAIKERTHEHDHDEALDIEEMSAEDIDGSFVPRVKPEVDGVEIDGEAVLVIEGPWSLHWLNQISTVVFNEFDGVSSIDEVADRLSRAFQADPEVVRSDVIDMTRQLGRDGFLEGVAAEAPRSVAPTMEGVPLGTAIPSFELPDLTGKITTLEDFRGQQTILVNWSLTCGFCSKIAPDIAELQPKLQARGFQTVLISTGDPEGLREQMDEFGIDAPVLVEETEMAEVFMGMGTPCAYLLDAEGKTASDLVFGANDVPAFLREAAGVSAKGNGAKKSTRSKKSTRAKKAAAPKRRAAARK